VTAGHRGRPHRQSVFARVTQGIIAAVAVSVVVFVPASGASATPAAGSIGIRLLDVPSGLRDDPRAHLYIIDHMSPGAVVTRRIQVSNTTADIAHIDLYSAAASIEQASFTGAAGHARNELSSWTSVTPTAPNVAPGGTVEATVTVSVPHDAAPGERYGVVWAEVGSAPAACRGINETSRVGIRLYISVGEGGVPAADLVVDSLTAGRSANGQPTVAVNVHNTGGRALDLSGTLELSNGPGGLSSGPFSVSAGVTLAIGQTAAVAVALDRQIPAGPWTAQVVIRSGLLERSAKARITFPQSGLAEPVHPASIDSPWLIPIVVGAPILLLLFATRGWPTPRLRHLSTARFGGSH
jgi:hypothetical protein